MVVLLSRVEQDAGGRRKWTCEVEKALMDRYCSPTNHLATVSEPSRDTTIVLLLDEVAQLTLTMFGHSGRTF